MHAGQLDRRWVNKHTKLLAGTGDLGRGPVHQELRRFVQPTDRQAAPTGWKTLAGYLGAESLPGPAPDHARLTESNTLNCGNTSQAGDDLGRTSFGTKRSWVQIPPPRQLKHH